MGRARRNQRDNIRKQRAKKRRKGKGKEEDIDISQLTASSRSVRQRQHSSAAVSKQNKDETSPTDQSTTCNNNNPNNTTPTAVQHSDKSQGQKPIAKKQPVERIERMRLKKQLQKARRKEKKAAREVASVGKR
jgi:hypothetical protein